MYTPIFDKKWDFFGTFLGLFWDFFGTFSEKKRVIIVLWKSYIEEKTVCAEWCALFLFPCKTLKEVVAVISCAC